MPFSIHGFKRFAIGGAVGEGSSSIRGLCSYHTNDDAATVEAADYFNDLASDVVVGDIILAGLDLDGTPAGRAYLVTANTGSAVTVAPFEATAIA